jgi:alkylation response protein AidB-like acyl-CoA dehydrogenase
MFMTLCPTYMGIAEAAFEFTCQYLRGKVDGGPPAGAARYSPAKQMAVAEMRIKLEQARALFQRAIREAGYKPGKDERLRAYAAQYTVMEYANDICRLAVRTCGGRSIFKSLRLEQLYRDSRCGSLMLPWTPEICMERLGRESLFDPGEK